MSNTPKESWVWRSSTAKYILYFSFVLCAIILFIFFKYDCTKTILNQLGEALGGTIGSLFTLVSVILFYKTLRTQQEELTAQKNELTLTRQVFEQQRFENTFFQLLNNFQTLKNNIEAPQGRGYKNKKGIYFLSDLSRNLEHYIKNIKLPIADHGLLLEAVKDVYKEYIYKYSEQQLSLYFRNLYHIMKLIDNSNIDKEGNEKKKEYSNLIRANLTQEELVLLYINCLNQDKFKKLINDYSLFKHLKVYGILDTLQNEYDKNAYL